jgi:hypothetical protein
MDSGATRPIRALPDVVAFGDLPLWLATGSRALPGTTSVLAQIPVLRT